MIGSKGSDAKAMMTLKNNPQSDFFDEYVWEHFIPRDHKLTKIKEFLDVEEIPESVKESYSNGSAAGNPSFDPRTLFLICVLEYLEDLSDIKVVEKIREIPVYRWFVGLSPKDNVPDNSTVSYFRCRRMGEGGYRRAFDRLVGQLHEAGLITGHIQSQDATHMLGNVAVLSVFDLIQKGKRRVIRVVKWVDRSKYERLEVGSDIEVLRNPANKQKYFERLIESAKWLISEVKKDAALMGHRRVVKEVALLEQILTERRDEYFDEDNQKLKKPDVEKVKGKMVSPVDPDVCWGAKSDKVFFAGYKVETNMDHGNNLVTAVTVEKGNHSEEKNAAPLLQSQKENIGIVPLAFTADAKYGYGDTRLQLKALGVQGLYIPEAKVKYKEGRFSIYDFEPFQGWNLICPAGLPAQAMTPVESKLSFEYRWNDLLCQGCDLRERCTGSQEKGRRVLMTFTHPEHREALKFQATAEYVTVLHAERYKIEAKQADMKRWHGLRRARYWKLWRVRIQAYLTAMAVNLKRWWKLETGKIQKVLSPPPLTPRVCPVGG